MTTRRDFIRTSAVAGLATGLGPAALAGARNPEAPAERGDIEHAPAPQSLSILILGGTGVTGPHIVARALDRGHSVTTFTRGRTEPSTHVDRFDEVEQLTGDRADDLTALEGRSWDAVIDNSGSRVEWTEASAALLEPNVGRYLYTSSTGVYYPYVGDDITEDTEVVMEIPEHLPENERGTQGYGVMKANSEAASRRIFGDERTTVVRPTYMMGPGDRTHRFTYWPVRIERGGAVLVPGDRQDPVQYIDSRDVARFMVHLVESGTSGTYNAAGPRSRTGVHAFVHGVHAALDSEVEWVYVEDGEWLRANGVMYVVPWIMPYGGNHGSARVNIDRALDAGLTYRPLAESVTDLLDWWHSDAVPEEQRREFVSGERSLMAREPALIDAWRSRD